MSVALLVIDVQESFRHSPGWPEQDLPAYLDAQNRLIAGARAAGCPIVRVFHEDGDTHFSRASGHVVALAGSDSGAEHTVYKHVHSALVDTGLPDWLRARGITRLIISGIRSEQCCETTARHASDLGFDVDYVTEATMTFPRRHPNGREFSTAEIKERVELALYGRFATLHTVDSVLATLS
ncbi:isochorismatase family protein [Massilia sp. TS11]|uniref:isochorismatase family protein n=1 Tax=Massilia sp. TS11 TaxID=2908003 RepID=UPI001EDA2DC9|nr:isochorismatase family protein [Massilia sp. TS11]MCG2583420.1 isochorismatase family protein [Massilia sp. TS11]